MNAAPRHGLPRAVDVVLAGAGLAALWPVLAAAAVAIRATSPGPALFVQERIGKAGRPFRMLKLRTMRSDVAGAAVTARGDARITPVGRLLRKSKIDELPELWNIVRGDMSFVGPRPEVPRYVDVEAEAWRAVLAVRPGLTDPVTLRLRNEEELLAQAADRDAFYRAKLLPWKLAGYRAYLARRSWATDVAVLAHTALAVMMPSMTPPPTVAEIEDLAHAHDA